MKKNIITLIGATCIALFIGEFVFSLVRSPQGAKQANTVSHWAEVPEEAWTELHPVLGWIHQKNKRATLATPQFTTSIETNRDGFRSRTIFQREKPSHIKRILALGDSFVFGFGVETDQSFPNQLHDLDSNLEVINSGVPGYGIDQMLLSFREIGSEFQPDEVLIGIFPEDFWRATRSYTDAGYGKPFFQLLNDGTLKLQNVPVQAPSKLNFDQFPEIIELSMFERLLQTSSIYRYIANKTMRLARDLGWIDPDLSKDWKVGSAILKQLILEVRAAGAKPVLLLIPPDRWMKHAKPTSFQTSMRRFATREDVDLIDLTPFFLKVVRDSSLADYYIEGDGHWTAKAHSYVTQVISQQLFT